MPLGDKYTTTTKELSQYKNNHNKSKLIKKAIKNNWLGEWFVYYFSGSFYVAEKFKQGCK